MVKDNITYSSVTREDISFSSIVRDGVVIFGSTPTPIGGDTELEYLVIPNNNCQFALLTIPETASYSIEFKVNPDGGIGASGFIGNDGCAFGIGKHYMGENRWMQWTDNWQLAEAGGIAYNSVDTIITLTHSNTSGTTTINGTYSTFQNSSTLSGAFYLDGGALDDDEGALTGRWYYAKEYLSGSLVHNYIPVIRETDSKVCLKDTISGTYITDLHGETWTAGPTK